MPTYRVEIDRTEYYTIEEIGANNEKDAVEIALEMIKNEDEDVIQEQYPDQEIEVFEAF